MQNVSNLNFGPLIAYIVPGTTFLFGLSFLEPSLKPLFAQNLQQPTVGGFLYLTIAAIGIGMILSAVRWATVDAFHSATGLRMPDFNFALLGDRVEAMILLIEIHYRHYLFYANMLVATLLSYSFVVASKWPNYVVSEKDGVVAITLIVLAAASRDTLRKYYRRLEQVLEAGSLTKGGIPVSRQTEQGSCQSEKQTSEVR